MSFRLYNEHQEILKNTNPIVFQEKRGFVPFKVFHELCTCYQITYNKEHLEELLKLLNLIVDDQINYEQFFDLINTNAIPLDPRIFQGNLEAFRASNNINVMSLLHLLFIHRYSKRESLLHNNKSSSCLRLFGN